ASAGSWIWPCRNNRFVPIELMSVSDERAKGQDSVQSALEKPPINPLVIPAKAGLRRQDAGASIGEADGPEGEPQDAASNPVLSCSALKCKAGSRMSLRDSGMTSKVLNAPRSRQHAAIPRSARRHSGAAAPCS